MEPDTMLKEDPSWLLVTCPICYRPPGARCVPWLLRDDKEAEPLVGTHFRRLTAAMNLPALHDPGVDGNNDPTDSSL